MGFTPGVIGSAEPWLNPKAGKLFRMAFSGHPGQDGDQSFRLEGPNIIEGFRRQGYCTIGSGAVVYFGWQPGLSYLINANSNGISELCPQPSISILTLCLWCLG